MCLYAAGFSAIALQSEMQVPSEKLVAELKDRFSQVDILYDNDFDKVTNPGQTMAQKICKEYNLRNIYLPEDYGVKDLSDYIAQFKRTED